MNQKYYPGYTGTFPNEPYKPDEPEQEDYIGHGAGKRTSIYYDIEMLGDSDRTVEEYFEDQEEEAPKKADKRYWENLTIQDIIDGAPPGTPLNEIIFDLSFPRHLEYTEVNFYHIKRDFKAEEAAYERALEKYKQELSTYQTQYPQYEKDLEAYESWLKEQEVKELEKKLAKLKK